MQGHVERPGTDQVETGISELAAVERLLGEPSHRPFPFTAAEVAKLLELTPQYVRNLANRDCTGVHRYSGGYDVWEVKRWLLKRNQSKVTRRKLSEADEKITR